MDFTLEDHIQTCQNIDKFISQKDINFDQVLEQELLINDILVSFNEFNSEKLANIIFNIERQLSNSLGFELELFCLEKKDVHKLRRL